MTSFRTINERMCAELVDFCDTNSNIIIIMYRKGKISFKSFVTFIQTMGLWTRSVWFRQFHFISRKCQKIINSWTSFICTCTYTNTTVASSYSTRQHSYAYAICISDCGFVWHFTRQISTPKFHILHQKQHILEFC